MTTSAKFITLDGIDGAGKTTNLNAIRDWFTERNLPVIFTREPGGTELGEALRQILLNPASRVGLRAETLMMFAARQQHLDEVIRPALAQGTHVVSDRFTDATFAYQGGGRGVPLDDIEQLEQWVQQGLHPDLTILLDVPLEVSVERINRSRDKDRFEQESADFFNRVRNVYLERAIRHPERYTVVDSSQDKDLVHRWVTGALNRLFGYSS